MRNQNEITKINHFLCLVSPVIIRQVKMLLQSAGMEVKQGGAGPDIAFSIKSGEKEVKFFLHNLLMEIATVDRDENPLRFDGNLRDFDYFLAKTTRLIQSKLNVLLELVSEEEVDTAVEHIIQAAKQYERIRIWKFEDKTSGR